MKNQNRDFEIKARWSSQEGFLTAQKFTKMCWLMLSGCYFMLSSPTGLSAYEEKNYEDAFRNALAEGDTEMVKHFIDEGVDVNRWFPGRAHSVGNLPTAGTRDWYGYGVGGAHDFHGTPPIVQALWGGVETIRLLLEAGADINQRNHSIHQSASLLYIAVAEIPDPAVARFLIEQGADLELRSEDRTALQVAAANRSVDHLEDLIEAGADHHVRDAAQNTILHSLIKGEGTRCDDAEPCGPLTPLAVGVADTLLQRGINPNEQNSWSTRPLTLAALNGDTAMVELLLSFGAEVDATDNYGRTALHWAADAGRIEIARILLEADADLDLRDLGSARATWGERYGMALGSTPLDLAEPHGDDVVRYLVEAAANK